MPYHFTYQNINDRPRVINCILERDGVHDIVSFFQIINNYILNISCNLLNFIKITIIICEYAHCQNVNPEI